LIILLLFSLVANVRRYGPVAAGSRWHEFLPSLCGAVLWCYYSIVALAKTVTPAGSPQALPGAACAALVLNFEICIIPHIVKKRLTSCIH